ncbi:forkhead-associated domain-containing protein 1 isoform X8 [Coturnix japonica]|uniref:forkhead-associated domain-containing protein 1 isoform X8 n=1 Tax=Coturnix japonica TaxID=93934 RepID=UPI0007770774|nr:forkhead-associated domain-containing protein 1 isoform X8 [Coturnix japonica]
MQEGGQQCEEGGLAFTLNGGCHGGLVAMGTGIGREAYKMAPGALGMHQTITVAFKPTHSTPVFEAMRAFLRSSEECFQLKERRTTIGRHEGSDIVLKSAGAEEHHAALEFTGWESGFVLQDLNSPQGTFVNGCQVQNAAVHVRPGDILRFGAQGASFELMVDGVPQKPSYPLAQRCMAWAAEPQHGAPLPSMQSQHRSSNWVGPTTHPPLRKRPISAWTRSATVTTAMDVLNQPPAERPAWTTNSRSSGMGDPFLGINSMDCALQEKDKKLLSLEKEIVRLSAFEAESKQKDTVIRELQGELASMAKSMDAVRNDVELTQKLLTFEGEIRAKTEEIKALKEQISNLQKGSSEVYSHSLQERDLEIGNLRRESEKLKRDHALITGLVTSLQREIAVKEQKIQQLKQEVEKTKKANREKDNQLAAVSAKCSRIKEEMKRELGEREVAAYQKRIGELECELKGLQEEVQKYNTEQKAIQTQLADKTKVEEELKSTCRRKSLQLQEMGRRERLLKSDMDRAQGQLESFKSQVMRVCSPQAAEESGKALTMQQVVEKVQHIWEENQQSQAREKCLQEEISSKVSKEKEMTENVEVFKKSLCELQEFLRASFCSSSLKSELSKLEAMLVDPLLLDIRAAVVEITHVVLSWLEGAEQLLASTGLELPTSKQGLTACLKRLLEKYHEAERRNEKLQAQLEEVQESRDSLLQERLEELKAKHEQDLQIKINQIILEKEEEKAKILESTVLKEKEKHKRCLDEEKKRIQDLESNLKSMAEIIEGKSKEQEVMDLKLQEAVHDLEEATTREMRLKQQVLMQDEQLKILQNGSKALKQKMKEEIAEYKEQIKQHSRTIVALEDRLLEAEQQQKELKEENDVLVERIKGLQDDASRSTAGAPQEAKESHCCGVEELAAMQSILQAKEAAIVGLTKQLSETRARMSDMRGELSEKQKAELEQSLHRVKSQEYELGMLRGKVSEMSDLVAKKDRELQAAAAELRKAQEDCKALKDASQRMAEELEMLSQAQNIPATPKESSGQELALDMANLGVRCRGLRHEETIQKQKEGLAELRERIKVLEKTQASAVVGRASELLVVQKAALPEKVTQKAGLKVEPAPLPGAEFKCSKCLGQLPDGSSRGAMSMEVLEDSSLSESMYLDLICALGRLMNMKELEEMQPMEHLPQEERENVGQQRRRDLGLLYERISKLKDRLERKEERLQEYKTSMEQLRLNQESLQTYREEMLRLEDEVYRGAEEKALLREALERMRAELDQEKKLNQAARQRKSLAENGEKRKGKELPNRACSSKERGGKPGAQQPSLLVKVKSKERVVGDLKAMGST